MSKLVCKREVGLAIWIMDIWYTNCLGNEK